MNTKNSKRSGRVSSKKVTISNDAKGLTSQAGLVPVVKLESQLLVTRILSCFLRWPPKCFVTKADSFFLQILSVIT